MSSHARRLQAELDFLRDSTIGAIRDRRLGLLKDGLDVYEELVGVFLGQLSALDSAYSRERALREIHSIGEGWSEVEWIERNYRDILDAGFNCEDQAVIDDVLYFPMRLAHVASRHRDYYI